MILNWKSTQFAAHCQYPASCWGSRKKNFRIEWKNEENEDPLSVEFRLWASSILLQRLLFKLEINIVREVTSSRVILLKQNKIGSKGPYCTTLNSHKALTLFVDCRLILIAKANCSHSRKRIVFGVLSQALPSEYEINISSWRDLCRNLKDYI